jgi:hypothetical protein
VEQAQQWLDTYDPKWMSDQVAEEIARELRAGEKLRWYYAILVDRQTNICHDGMIPLQAVVQAQLLWVARADDFQFAETRVERGPQGYELVTRKMDTVESIPIEVIGDDPRKPGARFYIRPVRK